MGATSVTGVGPGSAMPNMRGPGNNRNIHNDLLGAYTVAAGTMVLAAGVGTVTFPNPLSGSESGYVVHLTSGSSATATWVTAKNDDSDDNFESFEIAGASTDSIMWVVHQAGLPN